MSTDKEVLKAIHKALDDAFESAYRERSDRLIQLRDDTVELLKKEENVTHCEVDPDDPSQINVTIVLAPVVENITIDFNLFKDQA